MLCRWLNTSGFITVFWLCLDSNVRLKNNCKRQWQWAPHFWIFCFCSWDNYYYLKEKTVKSGLLYCLSFVCNRVDRMSPTIWINVKNVNSWSSGLTHSGFICTYKVVSYTFFVYSPYASFGLIRLNYVDIDHFFYCKFLHRSIQNKR